MAADSRIDWPKDIAFCDSCAWHTFQHTEVSTLLISEILQIGVPTTDAAVQRSRVLSLKGPFGLPTPLANPFQSRCPCSDSELPILEQHSCRFCGFCICVLFVHIPLAFCFYWFLQIFNGFQVAAPLLSLALHNFLFQIAEGVAFSRGPTPLLVTLFVSRVHHCGVYVYGMVISIHDSCQRLNQLKILAGSCYLVRKGNTSRLNLTTEIEAIQLQFLLFGDLT